MLQIDLKASKEAAKHYRRWTSNWARPEVLVQSGANEKSQNVFPMKPNSRREIAKSTQTWVIIFELKAIIPIAGECLH